MATNVIVSAGRPLTEDELEELAVHVWVDEAFNNTSYGEYTGWSDSHDEVLWPVSDDADKIVVHMGVKVILWQDFDTDGSEREPMFLGVGDKDFEKKLEMQGKAWAWMVFNEMSDSNWKKKAMSALIGASYV